MVDPDIVRKNNKFFAELTYYSNGIEKMFPNHVEKHMADLECIYSVFADVEKTFELRRIDEQLRVTGLQSFLPTPTVYAKVYSVIWSSFDDSDEVLKGKLSLMDSSIIQVVRRERDETPQDYYVIDYDVILAHYDRIERLWNEL